MSTVRHYLALQDDLDAGKIEYDPSTSYTAGTVGAKISSQSADIEELQETVEGKSTVSVSASGSASTEVQYITIDDTEYKLAGGGSGNLPLVFENDKLCWVDQT